MFWGLIMEPQRRYTQVVKKSFHISMAALDITSSTDEPVQVMCGLDGRNYLLCTLQKPNQLQCKLDLLFEEGKEVSFATSGKSHVHLTGYLTEEALMDEEEEDDDGSGEEIEEHEAVPKKRVKQETENGPPTKKKRNNLLQLVTSTKDVLETDSDDSDFVMEELETVEEEEAIEEENDDEEAESDEDEEVGSDEDGGEEESDDEGEGSEEEAEKPVQQQKKTKNDNIKLNGIDKKNAKKEKPTISTKENAQGSPKKRTLQGGVIVEDLKEGQGKLAKNGTFVTVYYEGRLKQNNKLFDSTTKGAGFSFRLGGGEVIKGWDIGVAGMKQGGKRRITCPAHMAYGKKGSPPAIPPNSTLVFDVELRKC